MTREDAERELFPLAHGLHQLAEAKRTWLHTFSDGKRKRPDWEIELRRGELATLERSQEWLSWMAGKYAGTESKTHNQG